MLQNILAFLKQKLFANKIIFCLTAASFIYFSYKGYVSLQDFERTSQLFEKEIVSISDKLNDLQFYLNNFAQNPVPKSQVNNRLYEPLNQLKQLTLDVKANNNQLTFSKTAYCVGVVSGATAMMVAVATGLVKI
jgi:hypothetical protein